MEASSPSSAMASVIDELTKAQHSVSVLSTLLLSNLPESPAARFLLEEIMNTISKTISDLESGKSQYAMEAQLDCLSSDITSTAPGENRKILSSKKSTNRKRGNPYFKTKITSAIIEDGYTWRKYGQKEILSAKHPRSYFRCTYRIDRGCKATKQVQRSEDDPFLYVINYFGDHTCPGAKKSNSIYIESHPSSFELNRDRGIEAEFPLSPLPYVQKEIEEEVVINPSSSNSFSSLGMISTITSDDLEFMDLEKMLSFDENIELLTW